MWNWYLAIPLENPGFSPWVGRSLVHNGQHGGPRLHREWGSGRYGSIMIRPETHFQKKRQGVKVHSDR